MPSFLGSEWEVNARYPEVLHDNAAQPDTALLAIVAHVAAWPRRGSAVSNSTAVVGDYMKEAVAKHERIIGSRVRLLGDKGSESVNAMLLAAGKL